VSQTENKRSRTLLLLWFGGFIFMVNYLAPSDFIRFFLDDSDTSFLDVFWGDMIYSYNSVPVNTYSNSFSNLSSLPSSVNWSSGSGSSNSGNNSMVDSKVYNHYSDCNVTVTNQPLINEVASYQSAGFPDINSGTISHQGGSQASHSNLGLSNLALNGNMGSTLAGLFKSKKSVDKETAISVDNTQSEFSAFSTENELTNGPQRVGIDPSGDPTGDPIPVGDGWLFMIALAIIYAFWQWRRHKSLLCSINGNSSYTAK